MESEIKRLYNIIKKINRGFYKDLAKVEYIENDNIKILKIKVTPFEGIHKNVSYIITCKFQGIRVWPHIFIDSKLYDKIKTRQYLQNKGRNGNHKGICIKKMSHGYNFNTYFEYLCGNKWENYIYNLIVFFNNIQDIQKGNGIKSNYKDILNISKN